MDNPYEDRREIDFILEREELIRQRDASKRNADRYLWLRDKSSRQAMTGKKHAGQIQVIQWEGRDEANVLTGQALDEAIDSAIKGVD